MLTGIAAVLFGLANLKSDDSINKLFGFLFVIGGLFAIVVALSENQ